jgi:glycosyltransferase involved in cell wall biosynthesis
MERLMNDSFEFIAIAPPVGSLAEKLSQLKIPLHPWNLIDAEENRFSRDQMELNLISAVREISPNLLHANSLSMGRLTGSVATKIGIPTSAHLRDIIKLKKSVIHDLNGNTKLVAVSQATKIFHIDQGLSPDNTEVIYNGVDCNQFQPKKRTGFLHQELKLPESSILTLTVGQIGLRKGQDILARASIDACQNFPELHVIIAGERNSQKQESIQFEKNIKQIFKQNHLEHRLHMIGYRNDIHKILNEVDLVIHPAHQEPLGRVLLEAGASGKAIIATDVGGTAEILENQKSARLIPPGDPETLSKVILELIADKEQRISLGEEARHRIGSAFSIESACRNLTDFFNQFRN